MIGYFFDTLMIKSYYNDVSKITGCMETVQLSHLKQRSCDKESRERYITIDGKSLKIKIILVKCVVKLLHDVMITRSQTQKHHCIE